MKLPLLARDGSRRTLRMDGCLYVPGLANNLLSVSQLEDSGCVAWCVVTFSSGIAKRDVRVYGSPPCFSTGTSVALLPIGDLQSPACHAGLRTGK